MKCWRLNRRGSQGVPPCLRASVVILISTLGVCGCCSSAGEKTPAAREQVASARGRTQMWAENCTRCHNARPASWYSEREWEVSMHHMQVRGYLTGAETRAITEFFRASK